MRWEKKAIVVRHARRCPARGGMSIAARQGRLRGAFHLAHDLVSFAALWPQA
jgi:hypothetical protein